MSFSGDNRKRAASAALEALDAREESGRLFVVMPLVEGIDLARLSRQWGPLPLPEACELIRQAAQGLEHARSRHLVHRDVKPSNLMLTADGQVKVLDLGLAAVCSEVSDVSGKGLTAPGVLMGTADYIAPEQCRDAARVDSRSDIYRLGCTLFHLLVGRPPYFGPRRMNLFLLEVRNWRCDVSGVWLWGWPCRFARLPAPKKVPSRRPVHRFLCRSLRTNFGPTAGNSIR